MIIDEPIIETRYNFMVTFDSGAKFRVVIPVADGEEVKDLNEEVNRQISQLVDNAEEVANRVITKADYEAEKARLLEAVAEADIKIAEAEVAEVEEP
jgi:hypothetical protein